MNQLFTKTTIFVIVILFFMYSVSYTQDSLSQLVTSNTTTDSIKKQVLFLKEGTIELQLPRNVRFLDKEEGKSFLNAKEKISSDLLGLLFLSDDDETPVRLFYKDVGYVSDENFAATNTDNLLKDKQEKEANYKTVLKGWQIPPTYDKVNHKFYWSEERITKKENHPYFNYFGKILGKEGVVTFSFKAKTENQSAIFLELLTNISFVKGYQYADFDVEADKVSPYHLADFLAGELVKEESHFMKVFKFWKFIILGAIGIFAILRRYRKGEKTNSNLNFE